MEVAKLVARVEANTSQAQRDLKQFSNQLERTATQGQATGRTLQSAFAGFAGGAAFAGISAVTSLLGSGLSRAMSAVGDAAIGLNARLQQSEIGFTTMLGSGEKARAFLDDLSSFAAKTPFEFEGLTTASQRMLAFGFAAEDVLPLLEDIGDAAAAMGGGSEGIDRITRALGQMQAKGRVMSEELLQLTEAGIPALQLLAEELNVTTLEAQRMVTAGEVSADQFITAFQKFSDLKFGGMMEAQARTFSGAMETIQDSLNLAIARGAEPFFERLSNLSVKIADFTASDDFDQWANRFATASERAFDAGERLGDVGVEILSALEPVKELAPLMTTVAGVTVGATQAMSGGWLLLTSNMIFGARAAAEAVGVLSNVAKVLTGELSLTEAGGSIAGHFTDIGQAAIDSGQMTQQGAQLMFDALGTGQATTAGLNSLMGDLAAGTRNLSEEQLLAAEHVAIAEATLRDYSETAAFVSDVNLDAALSAHELGAAVLEAESNLSAFAASADVAALMNEGFHRSVSETGAAVSHWEGMLNSAESALDHLQEKQDSGIALTEEEQAQYDSLSWAVGRYEGALTDDLIPAQIAAEVARAEYTRGLDELNGQLQDQTITQDEYNQKVFELAARTDPAVASQYSLQQAMTELVGSIDGLVEKVQALIAKYGEVPGNVNTDVTANTSPAESTIAAFLAQQRTVIIDIVTRGGEPLKGMSGPTQYASGGLVPHDQLALVGEQGPELVMLPGGAEVVNALDTQRMLSGGNGTGVMLSMDINIDPALDSLHELGRYIPHSPAETGPFSKEPDWDYVFGGIEASVRKSTEEAEDRMTAFDEAMRAYDVWDFVLGDLESIVSGDAQKRLQTGLGLLNDQLRVALELGAPQAIIDGLNAAIAQTEGRLAEIGLVMGTDVAQGMADALAAAEIAEKATQAVEEYWSNITDNTEAFISGEMTERLKAQLEDQQKDLALLQALGAAEAVLAAQRDAINQTETALAEAGRIQGEALRLGFGEQIDLMTDETLERLVTMRDDMNTAVAGSGDEFAAGLVDEFVDSLVAGRVTMEQAWELIPESALPELQKLEDALTVQLAEALVTGAENAGLLEEHLKILTDLMDGLKESAVDAALAVGTFVPGRGYYYSEGTYTTGGQGSNLSTMGSGFQTFGDHKAQQPQIYLYGNISMPVTENSDAAFQQLLEMVSSV